MHVNFNFVIMQEHGSCIVWKYAYISKERETGQQRCVNLGSQAIMLYLNGDCGQCKIDDTAHLPCMLLLSFISNVFIHVFTDTQSLDEVTGFANIWE